jgi:hypothetical protein
VKGTEVSRETLEVIERSAALRCPATVLQRQQRYFSVKQKYFGVSRSTSSPRGDALLAP